MRFTNFKIWLSAAYLIIAIIIGISLGVFFFSSPIFYMPLFIATICFGIFIFFKPFIGLLIYVFLVPFFSYTTKIKMPGFEFISIVALIPILILLKLFIDLMLKKRKLSENSQNKFLIAFFLIASASLIFAKDIFAGLDLILVLTRLYVLYFLITNFVDSKEKLKKLIIVALISALISCLFGFYQIYTGDVARDGGIIGPYGDPNDSAAFLIILMPLSLIFIKNEDKIHKKVFFSIIFLTMILVSILSFSIGGIIGLGVVFFLIFMESKKKALLLSLFIISLLIFSILYLPNIIYKQADKTTDSNDSAGKGFVGATEQRAKILVSGTKMFADNFLVGVGINNFATCILEYAPKEGLGWGSQDKASHDMYLQVAAELGILGIILFLALFYSLISGLLTITKKSKDNDTINISKSIIISIIGLMTVGLFLSITYYDFVWVIIGLSSAFIKISNKNKAK